jgi:hypothetical protein
VSQSTAMQAHRMKRQNQCLEALLVVWRFFGWKGHLLVPRLTHKFPFSQFACGQSGTPGRFVYLQLSLSFGSSSTPMKLILTKQYARQKMPHVLKGFRVHYMICLLGMRLSFQNRALKLGGVRHSGVDGVNNRYGGPETVELISRLTRSQLLTQHYVFLQMRLSFWAFSTTSRCWAPLFLFQISWCLQWVEIR